MQAISLPADQIEAILDGSLKAVVVSAPPPEPSSHQLYLHSNNAIWARADIKKIVEYTDPNKFAADVDLHQITLSLQETQKLLFSDRVYGLFFRDRTLVIKPVVYTEIDFQPSTNTGSSIDSATILPDLYLCSEDNPLIGLALRLAERQTKAA